MTQQLVTVHNVNDLQFGAIVELLHDIYAKEIPEIDITHAVDKRTIAQLMTFFANQYAYMVELWGTMLYHVRTMKRMGADKEGIDDAIAKRDYLEKVMGATKLKYYACSRLMYNVDGVNE